MSATQQPGRREAETRPITVITGGSEGIGLAIAHRFAADGRDLLLIARRPELLSAAADVVRTRHGVQVDTLSTDLTKPESLSELDAQLARTGRHIDTLVNNAGKGLSGPFDSASPEDIEALVALNVAAVTRLMRHVLPELRRRRSGGILNLASLGGYVPGPGQAAYYASKAYILSLSEAVAAEAAVDNVRVCAVAPGPVTTLFHAKMGAEGANYRRFLLAHRPETVAWWAVRGYGLGLRVVVPGLVNLVVALALRILPHRLVIPVVGWLLRLRGPEANHA